MRNRARLAIALFVLVLGVSCSADDNSDSKSARPTPTATTTGGSTGATTEDDVVSVALSRTGGLKPIDVHRVFSDRDSPPEGFSQQDVRAALAAAQAFVASGVRVHKVRGNTCCDRYEFVVTLSFADGRSASYATIDGLEQPKPFENLLRQLG